jgi:hypothetical protein
MPSHRVVFVAALFTVVLLAALGAVLYPNSLLSPRSPALCLTAIPNGALGASFVRNATAAGEFVNFTGDVRAFYPEGACPVPVASSLFPLISSTEGNPEFIAAENGSSYIYGGLGATLGNGLTGGRAQYFLFDSFSNATFYPCGPAYIFHYRVAEIQVGFNEETNGTLDTSNPMISIDHDTADLNVNHGCPGSLRSPSALAYSMGSMPSNFQLGSFSFALIHNGTGYVESFTNGTSRAYPGYSIVFEVSGLNATQDVVFDWRPPCSYSLGPVCTTGRILAPPTPNVALFRTSAAMSWFSNRTGVYLSASAY